MKHWTKAFTTREDGGRVSSYRMIRKKSFIGLALNSSISLAQTTALACSRLQ